MCNLVLVKHAKYIVFLAMLSVMFGSCLKKKEFPIEPIIEFKSFEVYGDSVYITISFTDGNGDIGKLTTDTLAPFIDRFRNNIWVDYLENQGGTWVARTDISGPDGNGIYPMDYHTPDELYQEYQETTDAMQGDITFVIIGDYYDDTNTDPYKYEFRLVDRALNVSNTVDTGSMIKP